MRGSLGSVVLGGSLSCLVHDRTRLPAERGERQWQKTALSEAGAGRSIACRGSGRRRTPVHTPQIRSGVRTRPSGARKQ
ncbi:hypothetical protein DVZ84_23855 [Streptomyces parvulus]|uniref:Uncharacterized protein n=1 Tax=Streptomyces parvulus TaxID=146923 RepID=A0A369V103_9ACTN|nr:hypothetical protein DVZ84_23855 [Streptomyces parvulus]